MPSAGSKRSGGRNVYVSSVGYSRFSKKELLVKALSILGVLFVILGILSFIVPVPHREKHGVKIGDAKFSVQTESSERLPPAVGTVLVAGGVVALIIGLRKA
jgi:hypothetical protein